MKRALLIGIDQYDRFNGLKGCVNDVEALAPLLARHEFQLPNFDCHAYTSENRRVDRASLLEAIDTLLSPGADVGLLYFAGHGSHVKNDVLLVTQDGTSLEPGIGVSTILGKAQ